MICVIKRDFGGLVFDKKSKRAIRVWLGMLSGSTASSCCYFLLANLGFALRPPDGDLEMFNTLNIHKSRARRIQTPLEQ